MSVTLGTVNEFGKYLQGIRGYSPLTVSAYTGDAQDYLEAKVSPETYIESLPGASSSKARKFYALRHFYKWGVKQGHFSSNPFADMGVGKVESKLPTYLDKGEFDKVLGREKHGQHGCILLLMFETGVRLAELCSIDIEDINLSDNSIVVNGKGSRQRKVYLSSPELLKAIRGEIGARTSGPLFLTREGRRLGRGAVQAFINRLSEGKFSAHSLRHSFASYALKQGAGLMEVKNWLGHASVKTTERYLHITDTELQEKHRKIFSAVK